MISISERNKWIRILENHKLVNLMHQKCRGEITWLNNLASVAAWAAPLLDRISDFFPLYTPHNYPLHVSAVLDTLEWVIPSTLKNEIEIHELFCLLAACLTHDVGMVVSQKKVQEISLDLHFQDYKAKVEDEMQKRINEDNLKRMWIRDCHHEKSVNRIIKLFESLEEPALGMAVSMIVRGHGIDPEQILKDETCFPPQYPIGPNLMVNIPALISYLRLADMFDCTRLRTPVVLYDFLDPDDPISRGEWDKHLAVLAISPDEKRENILATAKTPDHKVFLSLRKYERVAKNELLSCRQILSSQPNRYSLDLKSFSLDITTEGFEPLEWRFTVNREATLELLMGNNLYSDPTTCVRELLQNSVDACRQRAQLESEYKPEIHISLYSKRQELYLECKDNGIGMTSEIVEKFLLKVGQRYYESEFYKRLYSRQKRIEPTAKFGIGFLSCFVLGGQIIIQTKAEDDVPFLLEFQESTGYIIKKKLNKSIPQGTSVKIKISRILEKDFDLVRCVKKFVGLLEIPIFVYDKSYPKGLKLKLSGITFSRKELSTTFKPRIDIGLKGYVQAVEGKTIPERIVSQLGFRIPISNVLPDWATKFSQVIDLSGDSKMGLTTSREKISDDSKLIDINRIISSKIRQAFFNKFARPHPKIDGLRESWKILRENISLTNFVKQEDAKALSDLLLSLYLVGYKQGKHSFLNLNELNQQKLSIRIFPSWASPLPSSMEVLADQNQLFICAGAEFGYDKRMHDSLELLLNATGMPVWIPSEEMHAWEYNPQFPEYGWYEELFWGSDYSFSIDGWDIKYYLSAPVIYVGHCNSPFLLLKCPFQRGDLFFNSTLLASFLPKDKKAEADNIASQFVEKVIDDLKESVDQHVIDNTALPSYGSGKIENINEEIETNEIIETLSELLGEKNIKLSDDLLEQGLH